MATPEPGPPSLETSTETAPLVAPAKRPKDRVLPILIVGSLIVHALVFLPSLLSHQGSEAGGSQEIPVEVVQEAPSPPPPPPRATPPKPEAPKPQAPKPDPPRPEPPRPEPPKPQPPKPEPPKPAKQPADPSRENVAERMKDLLGGMPAIALPGEDPSGTENVSYEQLVLSQLRKVKDEGRHPGVPGAASVTFVLDDAGGVARVSVVHPSGNPTLDKEAVAMVYRGAPYPAPPPGARRDYTFTLLFRQLP